MILTTKKWHEAVSFEKKDTVALINALLVERGIETDEQREKYLLEEDGVWHDPFLYQDMRKAVDLIVECIANNKRILVYGDYDCDGVTATSILVRYFRSHNCQVDYIVPHRAEHGYGLTENIIDKVYAKNPDLLITVDCGITNFDTVRELKQKGISVIVSDHHNVKEELPEADAVICAKRLDNTYPCPDLCGAGVALKIVEALGRDGRYKVSGNIWRQTIELAGIATIADLVPVSNENRTIIKKAFKSMKTPVNPGVRIMNEILTEGFKKIDETFISFNFVPRINAAGRLYDSSDALKLFLTDDETLVREAAIKLGTQNEERKQIETDVFREAMAQIEDPNRPSELLLTNTVGPVIVYGANWHQGVLGIVAGKLSSYYRRSAIVFTNDSIDSENIKGSGRAYGEYDLFDALTDISDKCVNFGGHRKAAGLVVSKKGLGEFMRAIEEHARNNIDRDTDEETSSDDEGVLEISASIPFEQICFETLDEISVLKPFGIGNQKPIFSTHNLVVADKASMSDGAHIRLELVDGVNRENTGSVSVVGFNFGQYSDVINIGDRVDIAYTLNEYIYRGNKTLSLYLEDIVPKFDDSFVWNKIDVCENLYKSGMPLDQICKLAKCSASESLIPNKDMYMASYKAIFAKCEKGISTFDLKLLTRMVAVSSGIKMTPFQLRRCLDVFEEAGLMVVGNVTPERVCFRFQTSQQRAKLSETETFKNLSKYM